MVAGKSLFPLHVPTDAEEPRVLLHGVPWSTYVMISDAIDSKNVHMTYLEGQLEIMTTSARHEVTKTQIARLVELFCLERDIPLYGYGETTLRDEDKERGLEPDEWYSRGQDRFPADIALEVIVTNPLIDKLEVYRGLGIREVWVYDFNASAFRLLALRGNHYEPRDGSEVIPEIDLARVAYYLTQPDQHLALKAFRDEIRGTR